MLLWAAANMARMSYYTTTAGRIRHTNKKPRFLLDAQKVVCQQYCMLFFISLKHLQELLQVHRNSNGHQLQYCLSCKFWWLKKSAYDNRRVEENSITDRAEITTYWAVAPDITESRKHNTVGHRRNERHVPSNHLLTSTNNSQQCLMHLFFVFSPPSCWSKPAGYMFCCCFLISFFMNLPNRSSPNFREGLVEL